jgi:WD40-like Beta Propeller Repeat
MKKWSYHSQHYLRPSEKGNSMRPFVFGCSLILYVATRALAAITLPEPQIFAPGVVSGPASEGAPTFSPDGKTIFFTRQAANWSIIVESHMQSDGTWSQPVVAPFSGEWPDSSAAFSPDGSLVVFQSSRPKEPLTAKLERGKPIPGMVSNLWRVDRTPTGWSTPARLPDTVNFHPSIWRPSVATNGDIYFAVVDNKAGTKQLYLSAWSNGVYQKAQPLPFSDGKGLDVDPEIAPDESFMVFVSAGRNEGNTKDHLFYVKHDRATDKWGTPAPLRYTGDEKFYAYSGDDDPRFGRDGHRLYFSSDRPGVTHFPRSHEQAVQDFDRLNLWDNGNSNVWTVLFGDVL